MFIHLKWEAVILSVKPVSVTRGGPVLFSGERDVTLNEGVITRGNNMFSLIIS